MFLSVEIDNEWLALDVEHGEYINGHTTVKLRYHIGEEDTLLRTLRMGQETFRFRIWMDNQPKTLTHAFKGRVRSYELDVPSFGTHDPLLHPYGHTGD